MMATIKGTRNVLRTMLSASNRVRPTSARIQRNRMKYVRTAIAVQKNNEIPNAISSAQVISTCQSGFLKSYSTGMLLSNAHAWYFVGISHTSSQGSKKAGQQTVTRPSDFEILTYFTVIVPLWPCDAWPGKLH